MSLDDWLRNGWLSKHSPTRQETSELLAIVARDLRDAKTPGLSPEWKLNIAYNAALQAATAALAACGYRASRQAHHYRVIESLAHTIGLEEVFVRQLDGFRRKRNIGGYERAGTVSDHEAAEMLRLATDLLGKVKAWLSLRHPDLLS
ncbi:MAG: hypothetical protein AB1664_03405 [Thermodesulfobacteriota bacterium]